MLRTSSATSNVQLSNKPVFYAAVIDYYGTSDKQFYEHHFFLLQIFIDQQEYKIERSYASFCALHLRLRRQYPRSSLPKLPLSGLVLYEKKLQKRFPFLSSFYSDSKKKKLSEIPHNSVSQHHIMTVITKTAEINRRNVIDRKTEALQSVAEEGWQTHLPSVDRPDLQPFPGIFTQRSDQTENFLSKKLPLTMYLQDLISHEEILSSDILLQFLDEEIPDQFLYSYPSAGSSVVFPSTATRSTSPPSSATVASIAPDKDRLIPLSTYFSSTPEVLENLEVYLLMQKESLLTKRLKKETFTLSVPITASEKVFYLFFTDEYDIALTITLEETGENPSLLRKSLSRSTILSQAQSQPEKSTSKSSSTSSSKEVEPKKGKAEDTPEKAQITISPFHRYPSHEKIQWGMIDLSTLPDCQQGTILFHFDNTYSKWRSKQLYFMIHHYPEEIIQENIEKAMEIQQLKQQYQQKRCLLKQTFQTLANYLILTKNNLLPPYAIRMMEERQLQQQREEEGGGEEEDNNNDSNEEEDREDSEDSEGEEEGEEEERESGEDSSNSPLSRQKTTPSSKSKSRHKDHITSSVPDEISLEDLLTLQRKYDASSTITTTPPHDRASSSFATRHNESSAALEKDRLIAQITQQQLLNQLRQLTQEKKDLLARIEERDRTISALEKEKREVQDLCQQREERISLLRTELQSAKEEFVYLTQQQQQQSSTSLPAVSGDLHSYRYSIEELLRFSSLSELQNYHRQRSTPTEASPDHHHSPPPSDTTTSISNTTTKEKKEEKEATMLLAIENFETLFQYTQQLQRALHDLQPQYQLLQEQLLPKLKNEKKQLKSFAHQLRESLELKQQEMDYLLHEKDLLLQENERLKEQQQHLQHHQYHQSYPSSSSSLAYPQPSQRGSGSTAMTSLASSLEEQKSPSLITTPSSGAAEESPRPELITITREELQKVVIQVHELDDHNHDSTGPDKEEATSASSFPPLADVAVSPGPQNTMANIQQEMSSESDRLSASQEEVIPNYHFLGDYASEKKLVKINFEEEVEEETDDFAMAMEIMKDTFKDMSSWFSSSSSR